MNIINPYGSVSTQSGGPSNPFLIQQAKILSLPADLDGLNYTSTIKGQVISQNNNVNQIQTSQGIIDVFLKSPLPVGTRLDIQIPAGDQPRQAVVQPSIVDNIKNKPDDQAPLQKQQQSPLQTASTQNIADVKNLQNTAQQAGLVKNDAATIIVKEGQSVRLTPFPAGQQLLQSIPNIAISHKLQIVQTRLNEVLNNGLIKLPAATEGKTQTQASIPQPTILTQSQSQALSTSVHQVQSSTNQYDLTPIRVRVADALSVPVSRVVDVPSVAASSFNVRTTSVGVQNTSPQIDAQIVKIIPPSPQMHVAGTVNPNVSSISAGQVSALSTGYISVEGHPIIQIMTTTSGLLNTQSSPQPLLMALHYPAVNLPQGTQITLAPLPTQNQSSVSIDMSHSRLQPLQNITSELSSVIPAAQLSQMLNVIPQPTQPQTQQFPAAALLFLAAAKGGDLSAWLGPRAMKTLDQSAIGKQALKALSDGIQSKSARSASGGDLPVAQSGGDWRGVSIPLLFEGLLSEATLWTRYDDLPENAQEKETQTTRFLVDVTLSRMGDVQVDGKITPHKKQFDIALITEQPLAQPMQNHITQIWHKTISGLGMDGQILYKVKDA